MGGLFDDRTPGHGRLHIGTHTETGELFIMDGPDPEVLFADEVLWNLVHHPEMCSPMVRVDWQPFPKCDPPATCCQSCPQGPMVNQRECFYGSKLTIQTTTVTLIYIIGEYHWELNAWWAHWPD